MRNLAFHGRYAGLVSLGKTVGILLIVINLAAAFVLERYKIARVAMQNEVLQKECKQLRKSKAYLHSQISNLESLDRISSIASDNLGLRVPEPDRIVWLSIPDSHRTGSGSVFARAVERVSFLCESLPVLRLTSSSAMAGERIVE